MLFVSYFWSYHQVHLKGIQKRTFQADLTAFNFFACFCHKLYCVYILMLVAVFSNSTLGDFR